MKANNGVVRYLAPAAGARRHTPGVGRNQSEPLNGKKKEKNFRCCKEDLW